MTDTLLPAALLQSQTTESLLTTVQLPEQATLFPFNALLPACTVTVTHPDSSREAVQNALALLGCLYAHGVSSVQVLRVILAATGQKEILAPVQSSAAEATRPEDQREQHLTQAQAQAYPIAALAAYIGNLLGGKIDDEDALPERQRYNADDFLPSFAAPLGGLPVEAD